MPTFPKTEQKTRLIARYSWTDFTMGRW